MRCVSSAAAMLAAAGLAACAAPSNTSTAAGAAFIEADPSTLTAWRLQNVAGDLYKASCPEGVSYLLPQEIDFTATPVDLHRDDEPPVMDPALTFVGGFELSSEDPRFGGLSGVVARRFGDLTAVSDAGHFVWIRLNEDDGVTPVSASLSDMRTVDGGVSNEKTDVDAEGLAYVEGLALVSFEQDHRIEAFDLETCGAAARPALVARLPGGDAPGLEDTLRGNGGMEGLAILPNGALAAGLETNVARQAALSFAPAEGVLLFDQRFMPMGGRVLTGMDYLAAETEAEAVAEAGAEDADENSGGEGVLYTVHRSFSVLTGPDIALAATPVSGGAPDYSATTVLLTLKRPHTVDNFEAIAARRRDDGSVRLYMVSDDNYQPIQRTLLLMFDVADPA